MINFYSFPKKIKIIKSKVEIVHNFKIMILGKPSRSMNQRQKKNGRHYIVSIIDYFICFLTICLLFSFFSVQFSSEKWFRVLSLVVGKVLLLSKWWHSVYKNLSAVTNFQFFTYSNCVARHVVGNSSYFWHLIPFSNLISLKILGFDIHVLKCF